jgi:hypothetical protein
MDLGNLIQLTPWKKQIAVNIYLYVEEVGFKKASLEAFRIVTSIADLPIVTSSLIKARQEPADSKNQMIESILGAVVGMNIAAEEVSHFVTNFLLELQKEHQAVASTTTTTTKKPPVSGSCSTKREISPVSRKTKAKVFEEGTILSQNEIVCPDCNVVLLKKSMSRHRTKLHPTTKSEVEIEKLDEPDEEDNAMEQAEDKYHPRRRKRGRKFFPSTLNSNSDSDYLSEESSAEVLLVQKNTRTTSSSTSPRRRAILDIPSSEIPPSIMKNITEFLDRKGTHFSSVNRKLIVLTLKRFIYFTCKESAVEKTPAYILNCLDRDIISFAILNSFVDVFISHEAQGKTVLNNIRNLQIILQWRVSCASNSIGDESWIRRSEKATDHLMGLARSWKKSTTREASNRDQEFFKRQGSWISWQQVQQAALDSEKELSKFETQFDLSKPSYCPPSIQEVLSYESLLLFQLVAKCRPQRPAVYNSLSLQDWIQRQKHESGDSLISTTNFKTSETYKRLCFTVPHMLDSRIEGFVHNFRNLLVQSHSSSLFINRKGDCIDSGSIITDTVNLLTGTRTTITRIREAYRTEAAARLTHQDAAILDEADGHSPQTVAIYYNKIDREVLSHKADLLFFNMNASVLETSSKQDETAEMN